MRAGYECELPTSVHSYLYLYLGTCIFVSPFLPLAKVAKIYGQGNAGIVDAGLYRSFSSFRKRLVVLFLRWREAMGGARASDLGGT